MATQNLHLGANLLDDLSLLHLGEKIGLINQGLIFQEPIIQALIIHSAKLLGLLLSSFLLLGSGHFALVRTFISRRGGAKRTAWA